MKAPHKAGLFPAEFFVSKVLRHNLDFYFDKSCGNDKPNIKIQPS